MRAVRTLALPALLLAAASLGPSAFLCAAFCPPEERRRRKTSAVTTTATAPTAASPRTSPRRGPISLECG